MGKIRIKTLGNEQQEEQQKKKLKEKREHKKTTKAPGLKGGERVVSVGPSVEELEKVAPVDTQVTESVSGEPKEKKAKFKKKKLKGKRYVASASLVDKKNVYPLDRALDILKKFKKSKFDETVELHVNVKEKGTSGQVALPHGTGKKFRVEVALPETVDALVAEIEKGNVPFDILVAHPAAMGKLAKVAKILGPRGLMPNPKAGTISDKPQEVVEKLSRGQVNFKTESAAPIIHMSVGKRSFEEKQLLDNIKSVIAAIGSQKIEKATLKSTMSPGIRIDIGSSS